MDRISNLPANIIEDILLRIPLRDAVQTSILSHSWRYQWSTLPHLVFDENSFPLQVGNTASWERECVKFVDKVLIAHRGPIHKFELSTKSKRDEDIDGWILFLSRNGIKEIVLKKWKGRLYKIPSSLFSCEGITYLQLTLCSIILPASFKGFKSLTTLDLAGVVFTENDLQILISLCPLLKKLILDGVGGCHRLQISSMKLDHLWIAMKLEDLSLVSTPLVTMLGIELRTSEDPIVSDGAVCKLVQVFGSLPRIESLELTGKSMRFFSRGDVPSELPIAFHLNYLSIKLDFEDMQEVLAALSIFRSSPSLQTLHIEVHASSYGNYMEGFWKPKEDLNCLFSQLQYVVITNLVGTKSELGFIEHVLANAPVLETVSIGLEANIDLKLDVCTRMLGFARASKKARIVL